MFVLSVFLIERVILVVIVCVIDFTIGEIVCRVCFDGLFAVVVFVIDFTFDWWDSFSCLFVMVCFGCVFDWEIVWVVCCGCFGRVFDWEILDCLLWLFDVILFWFFNVCGFVRKKKNYGRTVHCKLPLLNPVSKWVRSDSNGWSFNLGVYCLLWKRFCVLNVALRMTKKLNRLRNSDGYVLVFKKTQRVVWPCFNCVDFMAQTVSAYSSAHKWFWLKKNNHRNAPWKMTDTDWTKSLSF